MHLTHQEGTWLLYILNWGQSQCKRTELLELIICSRRGSSMVGESKDKSKNKWCSSDRGSWMFLLSCMSVNEEQRSQTWPDKGILQVPHITSVFAKQQRSRFQKWKLRCLEFLCNIAFLVLKALDYSCSIRNLVFFIPLEQKNLGVYYLLRNTDKVNKVMKCLYCPSISCKIVKPLFD